MVINSTIAALLVALLCPALGPRPQQPAKASPQANDASAPAETLAEAEALLQKQQFAPAAEKLHAIVTGQPQNPQAWFDLGFAQSHLRNMTESVAAYRKAAELSPKWFEANLNLGLALARDGNNAEAAAALKKAVTLQPTTGGKQVLSKAWSALAQVLEGSQPQEALADYQKAAELDPGVADNFQAIAKLLEARGDLTGAEQRYRHAAEMGNETAVEQLINLYLKQKRLADAESWLQKYLQADPQNAPARVQLAKVLSAEGKTEIAISVLQAGNNNSDPATMRQLSLLYLENKQYNQAAPLLQQLSQNSPADAELHWNYGDALLHQHKYPEAEAELMRALQLNPRLTEAYSDLAYAADQNKHYQLAIRALDIRARYLPETAGTYWLRATSYDSLRAYKPAIENYKLFLQASGGKSPDQEFQARHRLKALQPD
jgi:tetratricopeptide (TPR) repeat protein